MRCGVLIRWVVMLCMGVSAVCAQATDQVLISGPNGIAITAEDVRQELLLAPAEVRADIMAKPELIQQTALALYSRRFLAAEALALGLDKQEETAVALERNRLKVLAETAITRRDGTAPDDAIVEKLAQSQYKANSSQYMTLEQARAAHVLIAKDKPNAKAVAEEVRMKLLAGEKIAELVQTYSDDAGTKTRGGDLGLFSRGAMVKSFEDAVFAMNNPNEISAVVETEFGFHVIQLYGKIKPYVKPFADVKEQIKKDVLRGLARDKRAAVNDEIMGTAHVDVEVINALAKRTERH